MKRKAKLFVLFSLSIVFLMVLCYFLLAFYYREGFCLNTWVNGVYCTGKTIEEINTELQAGIEAPIISIVDKKGDIYTIDMKQAGYQADHLENLESYMREQNSLLWIDNVTFHKNHELFPQISYDEDLLREIFTELPFVQNEEQRLTDCRLVRNWTEGYLLYDGLEDRLDVKKAFDALLELLGQGGECLDLTETDAYYNLSPTAEQQKVKTLWEKVSAYQKCDLMYDMGDAEIVFDALTMAGFLQTENGEILLGKKGELLLDEAAVERFVAELAAQYDTYGKERQFKSTRGDVITVKAGTYGTEINQKEEIAYLMKNLLSEDLHTGDRQVRIPSYKRETKNRGKDDIGNTYIEVDMTEQMMYYYEDGTLMLETEIVTGNISRNMGTPEGVNYVYNKQTDRILRGRNYASYVKFWMPVKGNYGIHDASWRSEFGGTIYQKSGSHGCINTPSDKMKELYEMVEVGTPVVMFY